MAAQKKPAAKKAPAKKAPAKKAPAKSAPKTDAEKTEATVKPESLQDKVVRLQKELGTVQQKHTDLLAEKDVQITALENENNQLKQDLTEALKGDVVSPEKREEIRLELLEEIKQAQVKAAAEQGDDTKEEKAAEQPEFVKPFYPAQNLTRDGIMYTLVQNPTGHLAAWTKERLTINENLFKAQKVQTLVEEVPEGNRDKMKPEEFYLLYRAVTVQRMENAAVKTLEDGKEEKA